MASKTWEEIGKALGKSTTLQLFDCTGCNLYRDDNLFQLLEGLALNSSIETIDLSDNDITDIQGLQVLNYLKRQSEKRD